jgi:prepilin signal peptidase PulO-like enzyme (type II secretory pathway)
MNVIIATIICLCNIYYSILYIEHGDYESTETKILLKKNYKLTIYIISLIITYIVYYYFGLKYSIGITFIISIILQDKTRYHISDLTSGLLIIAGMIYTITDGKFIPVLVSTAVVVFPYLMLHSYGPALIMVIKTLIKKDFEEEEEVEALGLGDIKVLVGIMMFMATKVTIVEVFHIFVLITVLTCMFILPKRAYLFIRKRKIESHFAFAPYILMGVIIYVEIIKKMGV